MDEQDELAEDTTKAGKSSAGQAEDVVTSAHNESLSGETKKAMAARIGLNDNKAGMEGLDKEKINQVIYENSKGTTRLYYGYNVYGT